MPRMKAVSTRLKRVSPWVLAFAVWTACTPGKPITTQEPLDAFARDWLALLQRGALDAAREHLSSATTVDPVAVLQRAHATLPEAGTIELLGYNVMRSFAQDRRTGRFEYHVRAAERSALVDLTVSDSAGVATITSFKVGAAPYDLSTLNPFVLSGMSIAHYVMLVLLVLVPAFMLSTLIAVLRGTRRWKWFWAAAMPIGIGQLSMTWSNPMRWSFRPLWFQLCGAGWTKMPLYAPWVLAVSIPLPALLYRFTGRAGTATAAAPDGRDA